MGWRRVGEYAAVLFGISLLLCGGVLFVVAGFFRPFGDSVLAGPVVFHASGVWLIAIGVGSAVLWVQTERRDHRAMMAWINAYDGSGDAIDDDEDAYLDTERSAEVLLREQRASRVRGWAGRLLLATPVMFAAMLVIGLVVRLQPVPISTGLRDWMLLTCTLIMGTSVVAAMLCLMVSRYIEPLPTER